MNRTSDPSEVRFFICIFTEYAAGILGKRKKFGPMQKSRHKFLTKCKKCAMIDKEAMGLRQGVPLLFFCMERADCFRLLAGV